ncbi:hypothetical protein [Trinickia terrae]|uniref:hypothetical protein n=1 Tax=Trinickia terrae TaxID=2571161 RepID=UPI001F0E220C|nr:hypothetical protein [Trinickia terrae]
MAEPIAFVRLRAQRSLDALSSTVAGFALLAGGRLFAFAAYASLREPVLGAMGLVLLALVGWTRWMLRAQTAASQGSGRVGSCREIIAATRCDDAVRGVRCLRTRAPLLRCIAQNNGEDSLNTTYTRNRSKCSGEAAC